MTNAVYDVLDSVYSIINIIRSSTLLQITTNYTLHVHAHITMP